MKKVILITGASRGLGNILANYLSHQGYRVYGGVRQIYEKKEDLFFPIHLDITLEKDLEDCSEKILNAEGQIDIIIHNAGLLYAGPPDSFTLEEMRYLYEVNVLGPIRLTQLVLPHMRERKQGQLIFISSIRGIESHAYRGLYSSTKAAIESVAFDWAISLSPWNIKVSVVEPGPLSTNPSVIEGSYFDQKLNPYPLIQDFNLICQSPFEITPLIHDILNDPDPHFRYQTNSLSQQIISSHLQDITGKKWLSKQKSWFNESIRK